MSLELPNNTLVKYRSVFHCT